MTPLLGNQSKNSFFNIINRILDRFLLDNYEEITNSNIQEKRILVSDLSEIITIAKEGGALIRKKTHRYNGICYIDKI